MADPISAVETPPRPAAPINRTLQWVVWSVLALVIAGIVVTFVRQQWHNAERRSFTRLDHFQTVAPFTLTERSGQPFNSANLRGKIWLADFFFTECPGPCLRMNARMSEVEQALAADHHTDVRLVSFSIAPQEDTPAVLRGYADRFHAASDWFFLTGDKPTIYDLAKSSFLLVAQPAGGTDEERKVSGEFIHSTKMALVDRHGVVRAYYDSTNPEVVQQVLVDIGNLLREEPPGA